MCLIVRRLSWLVQLFLLVAIISIKGQSTNATDDTTTSTAIPTTTVTPTITPTTTTTFTTIPTTTDSTTTPTITDSTTTPTTTTTSITILTTTDSITIPTTTDSTTTSTITDSTTTPTTTTTSTTIPTTTDSITTPTITDSTTTSTTTTTSITILTTTDSTTIPTTTDSTTTPTTTDPTTTNTTTANLVTTSVTTTANLVTTSVTTTDFTTITTTTTTTTTTPSTTSTTTPETCANIGSNAINVTDRTSTMFTALITYNCSFVSSPELFVYNDTSANCFVIDHLDSIENNTVNVTCDNIQNNAGRNWTFVLRGNQSSQIINDETFTITLEPLPLDTSTNISIEVDQNLTSASIYVPNCENITEPTYLVFRCNSTDMSDSMLSVNCTHTCFNLVPGSIYDASLVQLPIPIADMTGDNDNTFPQTSLNKTYITDLDKVTELSFDGNLTKNGTALIHFKRPRGYYDHIRIDCSAQDQRCWQPDHNLTNSVENCSTCTSISISEVLRGMKYTCQALTMKASFENVLSNEFEFSTNLESVLYNGRNSSNTSLIIFNVISQSDFQHIVSTCTVVDNRSSPCTDLTVQNDNCSTTLKFNGTLGCDYKCSFTTSKTNYNSSTSNVTYLTIYPPKPTINVTGKGSRWISITWTINEIAYIQSFNIFQNNTSVGNLNRSDFSPNATNFSHNYTQNIEPNRRYLLNIQLNSNHVLSTQIFVDTLEEAPKRPSNTDVDNKITPQNNNEASSSKSYVIDIDLSLFSDEYGIIQKYLIYVRQDQKNNKSEISLNGTYAEAQRNISLDYLAVGIPMHTSRINARDNSRNIPVILGNETECENKPQTYAPCNGPLKPSTFYKVVVGACTNVGCTYVLSKRFQTQNFPTGPSIVWVIAFPILALVIVAILLMRWKREPLKRLINSKLKYRTESTPNLGIFVYHYNSRSSFPPSNYNILSKRPKPLAKYVNISKEDEAIYAEYQELDNTAPQYRQSDYDSEYASYNRYHNITARGPWNDTAVQLIGDHRLHDYINANEIKGLYSDKQYIACQGPLQDTSEDFWDMIIQYKVSKIVMLTRTDERNPHNPSQTLSKCFRYFPENKGETLTFNRVTVQVIDIENRPNTDLDIRHILVKDDQIEHHVFHYYFTGWLDFSVVDQRKLLDLIETIDNHNQKSSLKAKDALVTPMVVHCSAGVGRTGTYVAVDIIRHLINQSQKKLFTMQLDVMGIVYQLRQDRGKMVQTKDQYMLVNRCVEECLRRTGRLNDILREVSLDENNQSEVATTDHYVNFTKPSDNSGLEASCSYTKVRRDSSSASGRHNNHSSVVYRPST